MVLLAPTDQAQDQAGQAQGQPEVSRAALATQSTAATPDFRCRGRGLDTGIAGGRVLFAIGGGHWGARW